MLTKQGYYYWAAYFLTLFWNMICACIASSYVGNTSIVSMSELATRIRLILCAEYAWVHRTDFHFYLSVCKLPPRRYDSMVCVKWPHLSPVFFALFLFSSSSFDRHSDQSPHQHALSFQGLAFAYLFIFAPLAYVCWFQSLYKAIMKDGASNLTWGWFFFTYLFQWVFVGIMTLGYPSLGGVGVWTASVVVSKEKGVGIVCWTCAIMWIGLFLFQGWHFKKALYIFKSSGGVS